MCCGAGLSCVCWIRCWWGGRRRKNRTKLKRFGVSSVVTGAAARRRRQPTRDHLHLAAPHFWPTLGGRVWATLRHIPTVNGRNCSDELCAALGPTSTPKVQGALSWVAARLANFPPRNLPCAGLLPHVTTSLSLSWATGSVFSHVTSPLLWSVAPHKKMGKFKLCNLLASLATVAAAAACLPAACKSQCRWRPNRQQQQL